MAYQRNGMSYGQGLTGAMYPSLTITFSGCRTLRAKNLKFELGLPGYCEVTFVKTVGYNMFYLAVFQLDL